MFTKWRIAGRIVDAYPQLGYPNFMRDGLENVWREEAAKAR